MNTIRAPVGANNSDLEHVVVMVESNEAGKQEEEFSTLVTNMRSPLFKMMMMLLSMMKGMEEEDPDLMIMMWKECEVSNLLYIRH